MKTMLAAVMLALAATTGTAFADEPIVGTWLRPSTGTLIKFSPCGGGFCGIVQTGSHTGKSIGKMSGSGANYSGSITDLDEEKTYKGKAVVNGNVMKLSGCVFGGLICKGENWNRQ